MSNSFYAALSLFVALVGASAVLPKLATPVVHYDNGVAVEAHMPITGIDVPLPLEIPGEWHSTGVRPWEMK